MARILLLVMAVVSLLLLVLVVAANLSMRHGWWRLYRVVGRLAPYVLGRKHGGGIAFESNVDLLRENGKLQDAVALVRARVAEKDVTAVSRNVVIEILITAGAYEEALDREPPRRMPTGATDALGLALMQINLAEAEYNLGRWDAAEARLRPLDLGCWLFPIARAGLMQQRAWIAAHRGRGAEALDLCASMKPQWLPPIYRAEYHFTCAAGLLAMGRIDEAEVAVGHAEREARRLSTRRNALFMRARIAAARGDWVAAEDFCHKAADHAFRGQGGTGLVLWAQALKQLGRHAEATEALRLAAERDRESEAARTAANV